jgi:4a-hydroxytetrahydrobiopterin dehydratase
MNKALSESLSKQTCKPCTEGTPPMQQAEIEHMLQALDGWEQAGTAIAKTFRFSNYYETIAFVNATAWVSHREDHHPDLQVGYNQCRIQYSTHSVGGLSENDFICAAKIDNLIN